MQDERHFEQVLRWLRNERSLYQTQTDKFDYGEIDESHSLEGLGDDSWMWTNGVLNYTGRVRLFGVTNARGVQALLKLIATLISMVEHLLRGGHIELPPPGKSSGDVGDDDT